MKSSAFSLDSAEQWALERAWKLPRESFCLTAYWDIEFIRQPVPQERKTRYIARIAQSENYGVAFAVGRALPNLTLDHVGKDVREILQSRMWRHRIDRTAFLDLVMGHLPRSSGNQVTLDGSVSDKYLRRATIFADEAQKIIRHKGRLKGKRPRALVIGATAGIIDALKGSGFEVVATDLSRDVVGTKLGGVTVQNARLSNQVLMKQVDLAVITGLALANGTLSELMDLAKKHHTSTLIWAITGRNFGHYYVENGVDCVIADPSPFLLFPGPARIVIHRAERR